MTKRGFIFLGVTALFLCAALATGARVLYLPAVCFGLLLILSLFSCYLAALSLTCTGTLSQLHITRGESVVFTVTMHGFLLFPVTGDLTVAPPGVGRDQKANWNNHVLFLRPGPHKDDFSFPLECQHHGIFRVGMEDFRVHDVFGFFSFPLFQRNAKAASPFALSVHPKIYPLTDEIEARPTENGLTSEQVLDADSGDSLAANREYRYGDPFKRINWKQTARTRKVYVRRYEPEENPQVILLIDTKTASEIPYAYSDLAADTAISLAHFYLENNCNARLSFLRLEVKGQPEQYNCRLNTSSDFSELDSLLLTLPFPYETDPLTMPLDDFLHLHSASVVHIITDQPSEQLLKSLKAMKSDGYAITCIVPGPGSGCELPQVGVPLLYLPEAQQIPAVLGGHL